MSDTFWSIEHPSFRESHFGFSDKNCLVTNKGHTRRGDDSVKSNTSIIELEDKLLDQNEEFKPNRSFELQSKSVNIYPIFHSF